jgi:hypothetical protein
VNGSPIEAAGRSGIFCRYCGIGIHRTPEHDSHMGSLPWTTNSPEEAWSDGVLLTCLPSGRSLWHEPPLPTLDQVRTGLREIEEDLASPCG